MPRNAMFLLRFLSIFSLLLPQLVLAQEAPPGQSPDSLPTPPLPQGPAEPAYTPETPTPTTGVIEAPLPAAATDENAMTLSVGLTGRVTGQYNSAFRIDPAGNSSTSGIEYSSRIRVRADADTKDGDRRWVVNGTLSVDAIDGVLGGGPDKEGDKLPGNSADAVALQDAYIGVHYGKVFGIRVGAMTSHWGTGLVANDGSQGLSLERNDWFTLTRAADRNLRVLLHSMPFALMEDSPLRGLMFLAAFDKVLDDDTASTTLGQNALQAVGAIRMHLAEKRWFGLYYVRRWQHHDLSALENPGKDIRVHVVDAAMDLDWRDKDTRKGVRLEAEVAGIMGDTSLSPTPEFPRHDIQQLGAFARATYVGVGDTGLTLQLDGGYFSGDANLDDGKLTAFRADRNFRQGLVLFDRVLAWQTGRAHRTATDPNLIGVPAEDLDRLASGGAVFDAITVFPKVGFRITDWLEVYGGALLAWAPAPLVDPLHSRVDAGGQPINFAGEKASSHYLATEVDLGARTTWKLPDPWRAAFQVALEQGILLPGGALGTLSTADHTDNHAYATRLTVSLLGR